jgi:hypothetical protein
MYANGTFTWDSPMITSTTHVEELLMEIQDAFLDAPELELTLSEAQRLFGVDSQTCREVLGALVDRGVLMRTDEGCYLRFFPRLAGPAIRPVPVSKQADAPDADRAA